jgi:hypothetical protein
MQIDLEWAVDGYLWAPSGDRLRWIPGVDRIARDTVLADARVVWRSLPGEELACSLPWRRLILLSPALYERSGCRVKRAWTHELGHILGHREAGVSSWSWATYGDLLLPVWAKI